MNHPLVQYSPEMEGVEDFQAGPQDLISSRSAPNDGVFNAGQLLELAAETLESRAANGQYRAIAKVINQASQTLSKSIDAPTARALVEQLRRIAHQALPFPVHTLTDLKNAVLKPGSAKLGAPGDPVSRAMQLFRLELEGLSPEDKEFELAKSFVRLTGEAVRRAVTLPRTASPEVLALRAVTQAARREAPGLFLDLGPGRKRTPTPIPYSKERTMHDIDRTQPEYSNEFGEFQGEQYEFNEGEWSPEAGGGLNESEEMELATELLSVSNEGELDRFLGDLVSRATKAVGSFVRSPIGQAVGGVLKGVAKKALPMAGAAVGSYFGGPLGAKIGSGLANAASNALGLEGEMSGEDREFEGAKQFVRLAAQTAAKAASAPPGSDPRAVAQQAAIAAARQLAPGLLSGGGAPSMSGQHPAGMPGGARHGRWMRRGSKIVLYGA